MRFSFIPWLFVVLTACGQASSQDRATQAPATQPAAKPISASVPLDPATAAAKAYSDWQTASVRQQWAKFFGLPDDASFEQIIASDPEPARKYLVQIYGLPENTTWEQLRAHEAVLNLAENRKDLGLPEIASQEEVYKAATERRLAADRKELGLPDTATYQDVLLARSEAKRAKDAAALNLPPTATREEVAMARNEKQRQDQVKALGLPPNATIKDVYLARARGKLPNGNDTLTRARNAAARGQKNVPTQPAPTPEELKKLQDAQREQQRIVQAKQLGLPETATWEEISKKKLELMEKLRKTRGGR